MSPEEESDLISEEPFFECHDEESETKNIKSIKDDFLISQKSTKSQKVVLMNKILEISN